MVLENQLRRKSHGSMALRDYVDWLAQAGAKMPSSRRTLHEDLRRYADFCDDLQYGENAKTLEIDTRQTRDATAWLMGQAWADSPLQPYLPSAMVRCLLLAKSERAEVQFNYRRLRNAGEAWQSNPLKAVPLELVAGSDAGYMLMFGELEGVFMRYNVSLSRVSAHMHISEKTLRDYPPAPSVNKVRFTLKIRDRWLMDRLTVQFQGFVKQDRETLTLEVDEHLAVMMRDLLQAHLSRTRSAQRNIEEERLLCNASICCKPV